MAGHGGNPCIFSVVTGGTCTNAENALLAFNHHVSGLRTISNTPIGNNALSFLLLLAAFLFCALSANYIPALSRSRFSRRLSPGAYLITLQQQTRSWLAVRMRVYDGDTLFKMGALPNTFCSVRAEAVKST